MPAPSSSGRSLPYDARSCATSTISRAPSSSTSRRIESTSRLRCGPRNDGIAQNPHERSQPSAIFTYAHGLRRLRSGQVEQIEQRHGRRGQRQRPLRGRRAERNRHGARRHAEAGDLVDLGQRLGQLVAVALGHAAGDDQPGAGLALVVEREDRVDRLLARLLDERARVDDDEVGRRRVVGRRHPVGQQRADQLVAVDLVLGAAQGLDVEPLPHGQPGYRRTPDAS